jgi:Helix-turn-helix domain
MIVEVVATETFDEWMSTLTPRERTEVLQVKKVRIKTWDALEKKYFTAAELAEADRYVEQEILEMNLRELRRLTGFTQEDVAQATQMRQPELSRVERRDDHLLSTLRRYIEALGGKLEVIARFDKKSVKLRGV